MLWQYWEDTDLLTGIVLCIHPANERLHYIAKSSLIGLTHTPNAPYSQELCLIFHTLLCLVNDQFSPYLTGLLHWFNGAEIILSLPQYQWSSGEQSEETKCINLPGIHYITPTKQSTSKLFRFQGIHCSLNLYQWNHIRNRFDLLFLHHKHRHKCVHLYHEIWAAIVCLFTSEASSTLLHRLDMLPWKHKTFTHVLTRSSGYFSVCTTRLD